MTDEQHESFMREAIAEAQLALAEGEVPVGAIIVFDNKIIARAHNQREATNDPTAHAELLALRSAAQQLNDWRLNRCALYVTLEPCPMCAGAITQSRIAEVVFGAYDAKQGCCGSLYRLTEDPAFDGYTPVTGGVLEADCTSLLRRFFVGRRYS